MAIILTERSKKVIELLDLMEQQDELNNTDIYVIQRIIEIGQFRKKGMKKEELKSFFLRLLAEYIYEIQQEAETTLDEIVGYIQKNN